jgi:predicted transcriptional regulator
VYFQPELLKQVATLADRKKRSRSAIVKAAVASFLSLDGSDRREAVFTRRLFSRQLQRLDAISASPPKPFHASTLMRLSDEGYDRHDYALRSSAERKQRDSSNHFGRYRLSERFVGHNKKWLATTGRRLYRWRWLR